MRQTIQPKLGTVEAVLDIPGSKSITNRVLLMASLAEGRSLLSGVLASEDTRVMVEALRVLGVDIDWDIQRGLVEIDGCAGRFPNTHAKIDTHESGTATRFLIPAVAVCGDLEGDYCFDASERMRIRPIRKQLEVLENLGVGFEFKNKSYQMPFNLKPGCFKLNKNIDLDIKVDIQESSQFLSGLMMAAPYFARDSAGLNLRSLQGLTHKPYVEMTAVLMREFGVEVDKKTDQILMIKPGQYQARKFQIEPDISTASYFFAIPALLGGKIKIKNIERTSSLQGDIKFLEILEHMGCQVWQAQDGVCVSKDPGQVLQGLEVDMAGFTDVFMTVAVLACVANGRTVLKSLAHTRLQESDRIDAMQKGLRELGVWVESTEDCLIIDPARTVLKAGCVDSFNDHRIAMSLSLLGLLQPGVEIDNSQAVAKTCPNFYNLLAMV